MEELDRIGARVTLMGVLGGIGGAASADGACPDPNRPTSASSQVELLSSGADILVHSVIHPIMTSVTANNGSPYPGDFYCRQTNAPDLGAMAENAGVGVVMLSHLIPSIGAEVWGIWNIQEKGLSKKDWKEAVENNGAYTGKVVAGGDLKAYCLGDCPPCDSSDEEDAEDCVDELSIGV